MASRPGSTLFPLVLAAAAGLAACVPLTQEQIARETARNVVRPILADQFPGLPVELVTDCVIDNATVGELNRLARTSVTGLTPEAFNTIVDVAARPATVACFAAGGSAGTMR